MDALAFAKDIVKSCLQLDEQVDSFDESTELLGAIPEVNSLTIVNMVTSIEEQLGVEIGDEELSAEVFETMGSFAQFIESKM
jgi:acyl carrier protein